MKNESKPQGSDLFIVDNSDTDWKVKNYLHDWTEIANKFDIATGYFEIGALLALDGQWQKLEKLRILMGDEVSKRTKNALLEGIRQAKEILDDSIEKEKETNDFLTGVPAIVDAVKNKNIECRIYTKDKFHAKAYITHGKVAVVGSTALVGSSNFTYPGLTDNVELNVQLRREVELLQEWYERHWNDAEEISAEILKVIERHTREYTPFDVYAKSLHEYFKSFESSPTVWEESQSRMYPILDQYQKDGYHGMIKIASKYGGAFICDGVGLGKTFVGLMIIERLIKEKKRVALFVPKATRKDVWERDINKYLSHVGGLGRGVFSSLQIFNHTDLGREGDFPADFERIKEMADAIIIDEAHHFRNPGIKGTGGDRGIKGEKIRRPSRYRLLSDLIDTEDGRKELYLMTATPINNRLDDFRHMVELFTRQEDHYFKSIGIHSLRGHFIKMEKNLKKVAEDSVETNLVEADQILSTDKLFRELVVQRSRAYVKKSQIQETGASASFPEREVPKVGDYSVKKTYGRLLDMVEDAFRKDTPLFVLGIYYPLAYYKGTEEIEGRAFVENRQKQVVGLIRTMFLKRFESSAHAFERSCERLMLKLLTWVEKHSVSDHDKARIERWKRKNADLIGYVHEHQKDLYDNKPEDDADEDLITEEMLEAVDQLSRDEYNVDDMLDDTYDDLSTICDFLNELKKFKPRNDDKLKALIKLLKNDKVLKKEKVLIFTEFSETARYLKKNLIDAEIQGVAQIDGSITDRSTIIQRFAPYYNDSSSADLAERGIKEIRVLISTDVLSEGLNLQDATRLINYDLHWNPVRLMQRIGRVDRRMNPETEEKILDAHPEQKDLRGNIAYWNFLPPDELEILLKLYTKVSHKTLRISKTLGIEGKKLLTPDDDYDALKDFNHSYEGTTTPIEEMHLEYQELLKKYPDLLDRINMLPKKVFSGKQHPNPESKGVFFCYSIPALDSTVEEAEDEKERWTEEAGSTHWYFYDLETEGITSDATAIVNMLRSEPDTPRHRTQPEKTLSDIRKLIEKNIKNKDLKQRQAPIGIKASLKAWMELS